MRWLFTFAYRERYGYPWPWAILAEFWWRVEHVPFRCARNGVDDGPLSRVGLFGYRMRKACEHRGSPLLGRLMSIENHNSFWERECHLLRLENEELRLLLEESERTRITSRFDDLSLRERMTIHHALRFLLSHPFRVVGAEEVEAQRLADEIWDEHALQATTTDTTPEAVRPEATP